MTAKEQAHKIIDTLPEEVNLEDVIQALYVNIKFTHGEHEITEGHGIKHSDAKNYLNSHYPGE